MADYIADNTAVIASLPDGRQATERSVAIYEIASLRPAPSGSGLRSQ